MTTWPQAIQQRLVWVWDQGTSWPGLYLFVVVIGAAICRYELVFGQQAAIILTLLVTAWLITWWRGGWRLAIVGLIVIGVTMKQSWSAWYPPQQIMNKAVTMYFGRVDKVDLYGSTQSRYWIEIYHEKEPVGRAIVSAPAQPWLLLGQRVAFTCQLEQLVATSASYAVYLRHNNVSLICRQTEYIKQVSDSKEVPFSWFWAIAVQLSALKQQSWQRISQQLAYPYADLLLAITVGLPVDLAVWQRLFRQTGMSHVLSVSGYNLTVVSVVLARVIPLERRSQGVLQTILVGLFVILAGLNSAVLRAGCFLVWQNTGRQLGYPSSTLNALAWSCLLTIMANPRELFSLSLYLSVGAMLGIVIMIPVLSAYWRVAMIKSQAWFWSWWPGDEQSRSVIVWHWRRSKYQWPLVHTVTKSSWWHITGLFICSPPMVRSIEKLTFRGWWGVSTRWGEEYLLPSLAATSILTGILLYSFGEISPLFLISNVLTLWLIGWLTAAGIFLLAVSTIGFLWNRTIGLLWPLFSAVSLGWEIVLRVNQGLANWWPRSLLVSVQWWEVLIWYLLLLFVVVALYPLPYVAD